jgi:cytochrome P450
LAHYKIAPGSPGHFLFGSTRDIRHDPLRFGLEMARNYGDIVRIRLLFWPAYLVNHPDGVKHVLQENQQNYHKDLYPYRILKPLLGQGLVTNDGDPGSSNGASCSQPFIESAWLPLVRS